MREWSAGEREPVRERLAVLAGLNVVLLALEVEVAERHRCHVSGLAPRASVEGTLCDPRRGSFSLPSKESLGYVQMTAPREARPSDLSF